MNFNKTIFTAIALFSLATFTLTSCGGGEEKKEGDEKEEEKKDTPKEVPMKKAGELKIGYIDMDSLNATSKLLKLRSDELAVEEEKVQNQLKALQNNILAEQKRLEKEFQYLPLSDQEKAQKQFMEMNQRYQKKEQDLMAELQKKQNDALIQMNGVLTNFIEKYAKENGYDIILKHSSQLSMFYMDKKFNVTKDIVDGLNSEFDKANGK